MSSSLYTPRTLDSSFRRYHNNVKFINYVWNTYLLAYCVQAVVGEYVLSLQPPWLETPLEYTLDYSGAVVQVTSGGSTVHFTQGGPWAAVEAASVIVNETVSNEGVIRQSVKDGGAERTTTFRFTVDGFSMVSERVGREQGNVSMYSCTEHRAVNTVEVACSGTVLGTAVRYSTAYSAGTRQLETTNRFQVVNSHHTQTYSAGQLEVKVVNDIYGAEVRVDVKVAGRELYTRQGFIYLL